MLPAQRRQELQQLAVHRLAGLDQPLGGAFQVHRVPQHDSRRHQVEAAGPVALLLEAPIPDFPKAVEEHRPGQRGCAPHLCSGRHARGGAVQHFAASPG